MMLVSCYTSYGNIIIVVIWNGLTPISSPAVSGHTGELKWSWSPKRLNVETKSIRRLKKCPPCRLSSSLQPTRLQQKHLETLTAVSVVTKVLKAKLVMVPEREQSISYPKTRKFSLVCRNVRVKHLFWRLGRTNRTWLGFGKDQVWLPDV